MMAENSCYQTAKGCAGEVLEALYTIYWADSFDAALLESRLVETIHFLTCNARKLTEPHPNPEALESDEGKLMLPSSAPNCLPVGEVGV